MAVLKNKFQINWTTILKMCVRSCAFTVKFLQAASDMHRHKKRSERKTVKNIMYSTFPIFSLYTLNFPESDRTMHCVSTHLTTYKMDLDSADSEQCACSTLYRECMSPYSGNQYKYS